MPRSYKLTPLARMAFSTVLAAVGCGGAEPPPLEVGGLGYSQSDLRGLPPEQIDRLVLLSALGWSVAQEETDRLTSALVTLDGERIRVRRTQELVFLEAQGVGEAEMRTRYQGAPEPELVVRHLVILSERWRPQTEREVARQRAGSALGRILAGEDFARVAGETSEEPGALDRGGLLTPGREGSWVREFWVAASGLPEGGVSGVVESEYGFHVLSLDERRAVPYEEARGRWISRLVEQIAGAERVTPPQLPEPGSSAWAELLDEADRRGVVPDPAEVEASTQRWSARIGGWAETFGFQRGMRAAETQAAALRALGLTGQGARIAREELLGLRLPLEELYPVRRQSP